MQADATLPLSLHLQRRAIFSIPDAAGLEIRCRDGTLWLTLDHDRRDIVLASGESFTTDRPHRAVLYAMEPSCVAIAAAAPAAASRRQPAARPAAPAGLRAAAA